MTGRVVIPNTGIMNQMPRARGEKDVAKIVPNIYCLSIRGFSCLSSLRAGGWQYAIQICARSGVPLSD